MTPDAIASHLAIFIAPGQVTELRALHVGARGVTYAGWFDGEHLRDLARHALALTRQAAGVFFIPNPVAPSLLDRCRNTTTNVVRRNGKITPELTHDRDILERRYLIVDLDPYRCVTLAGDGFIRPFVDHLCLQMGSPPLHSQDRPTHWRELAFVRKHVEPAIRAHLKQRGASEPLVMMSGNGIHLVYKITPPLAGGIVNAKRDPLALRLKKLSDAFSCSGCTVDVNTFTPARMLKVPGTLVRKGDTSKLRPHRTARIIEVPNGWTAHAPAAGSASVDLEIEYQPEFLDDDSEAVNTSGVTGETHVRSDARGDLRRDRQPAGADTVHAGAAT